MESFNKYEITGIAASIIVVVVIFAAARFFSFDQVGTNAVFERDTDRTTIVLPSDINRNIDEAVSAVEEGVSSRGEVNELIIQDVAEGEGRVVQEGDTVSVHYIGVLESGIPFDNSYVRGEPFTFTVGVGEVIEGWDVGIVGMREGGERILIIPADMAYGNRTVGPIPPNSPLLFAVEIISIQ